MAEGAEIIDAWLPNLRAIGVVLIVVTDLGAVDGTADSLASDPDICLIRLRRDQDPWGFPARSYLKTISEFAVDRVLFLDADEFWLPQSGNLKTTVSLATADALSVRRLNMPLVAGRPLPPAALSPAGDAHRCLVRNGRTQAGRTLERGADVVGAQDTADQADSCYTKEFLFQQGSNKRHLLVLVQAALRREHAGDFGLCAECQQPVQKKRLEAVPWALHCMNCQELQENGLLSYCGSLR